MTWRSFRASWLRRGGSRRREALWDGLGWRALGDGLDGQVWAVAALGNELMVSGPFGRAGAGPSYGVARWMACPPCLADLDSDGVVDFSDYLAFLNFYEAGDPAAISMATVSLISPTTSRS